MPYVLLYIKNILVVTKESYWQHFHAVDKVLEKLKVARIQLNIDKLRLAKVDVNYLGYIINREGIDPQLSKV